MKKEDFSSRAVALEILQAVLRKNQALDETMATHKALSALEKRDRGFVHALVACTLRRLGQIDATLKACLEKPQEVKAPVMDILRLGAAQILFLGTPSHAAVDTAVELAAAGNPTRPFKGLINAVLRRLTREGEAMVKAQDAARLNTPDWLWLSWRQTFGTPVARDIATAHLGEALTDISVKSHPQEWAQKLGAKLLPTGSLRLDGSIPVQELEGFTEGEWWVQDAAAALPAKLLKEIGGHRVMDLCAAPGGKTLQLAARGARVSAVDRSEKRLVRLRENLERTGLEAAVFCADALTLKLGDKVHNVLLDAPCSATGTIRRHPDVQRLKKPEDVARMAMLQARLLEHVALDILADGGTMVYAVCSLQPEEAEHQIENFLKNHAEFKRDPIAASEVGGASELITSLGDVRCLPCHWPEHGGLDGFYAARLMKK
ncbi:MAG TPA: 16S rRNA (cytosine(967)-C(5))-methyltransferase [Rhodospirillaceae bacterium]|nr:16S rRNA (cytosine(967)-C(5))-methyltransferase [Rhodospirillaceae bacterium]